MLRKMHFNDYNTSKWCHISKCQTCVMSAQWVIFNEKGMISWLELLVKNWLKIFEF